MFIIAAIKQNVNNKPEFLIKQKNKNETNGLPSPYQEQIKKFYLDRRYKEILHLHVTEWLIIITL